jgi:hypothetical protein
LKVQRSPWKQVPSKKYLQSFAKLVAGVRCVDVKRQQDQLTSVQPRRIHVVEF